LPFIGDLLEDVPGVGLLVSRKNIAKEKTELIFFVTVNIVSPAKKITSSPDISKMETPKYNLTEKEAEDRKKKKSKRWLW
jgi:Flp pilus assembly secretin CpaC